MSEHTKPIVVRTRLSKRNTEIKSVSYEGDGRYCLKLSKEGGISFALKADSQYAFRHMVTATNSDTVSVYIVEKR